MFRAHSGAVYFYCFHRLGSWSAAEDATSVVFLEAWRRRADVVAVSGSLERRVPRSRQILAGSVRQPFLRPGPVDRACHVVSQAVTAPGPKPRGSGGGRGRWRAGPG
ncbi:RNA polymerase sigma factor [Frankia gtarii]